MKTVLLTISALIAFAANSILCKLALKNNEIDATTFTLIRLISGAAVLYILLNFNKKSSASINKGSWLSGVMLFLYAITFSFAYITLDTGTGALILFGTVQITIISHSIFSGNKLNISEWLGVLISFIGFVYLMLPSASSPAIDGFLLMAIAGISWGIYTIKGKKCKTPLIDTTFNFLKASPLIIFVFLLNYKSIHYSIKGLSLALISGVITSGIGYTIWYMAIRNLTAVQTAVVQLLVPVLAAFGGVLFISEVISMRLAMSSTLILGGILMISIQKKKS
jgi:drug/metabolite transporter (DMT)-like permease